MMTGWWVLLMMTGWWWWLLVMMTGWRVTDDQLRNRQQPITGIGLRFFTKDTISNICASTFWHSSKQQTEKTFIFVFTCCIMSVRNYLTTFELRQKGGFAAKVFWYSKKIVWHWKVIFQVECKNVNLAWIRFWCLCLGSHLRNKNLPL